MTLFEKLTTSSLDPSALDFVPGSGGADLGTTNDGAVAFSATDLIRAGAMPVAEDFGHFLELLCYAPGSLIAQAPHWTRLRFQWELTRQSHSKKQQMVRNALRNGFRLPSIQDPYGYIHSLQQSVAPSATLPGKHTTFGSKKIHLLSQEISHGSILLRLAIEIPGEQILSYADRWQNGAADADEALAMEAGDPFILHADVTATINGKKSSASMSDELRWNPLEDNTPESSRILAQYGLDPEQGWFFATVHLKMPDKKKKRVKDLALHFQPKTLTAPGPQLTTPTLSQSLSVTHPISGQRYQFHIHSLTQEGLDPNFLTNPPCFYSRLCYFLTPPLAKTDFSIEDSVPNDRLIPPPGMDSPYPDPKPENIPTADLAEPDEDLPAHIRTAFSARHYQQPSRVLWRTRFCYTPAEPTRLILLP